MFDKHEVYADIEIARKAMSDTKLYSMNILGQKLYDIYCIPSHNSLAFYAELYRSDNNYFLLYARTEINDFVYDMQILMYPFSEAAKGNDNRYVRKIICGLQETDHILAGKIEYAVQQLPVGSTWCSENGICIDGTFQMIRVYDENKYIKEFAFTSCYSDNEDITHVNEWIEDVINRK